MVKFRFPKKKPDLLSLKDKLKNKLRNKFKGIPVNRGLVKSSRKILLSPKNRMRIINILLVVTILIVGAIAILYKPAERGKSELTQLLTYTKENCEDQFAGIVTEIEQNPLSDLIGDKLPTSEEVFFAEWANDWFPRIDIPIVGSIIEELGAEKVGDVDLDGLAPYCDLNITSHSNPSNLSLEQCVAIWNPNDPYSLLVDWPELWYAALENDQESIHVLIVHFNLSYSQWDLIFNWLNTSNEGWMSNIKAIVIPGPEPDYSAITALGIVALSVVACDYLYQRNLYLGKARDKITSKLEKRRAAKKKAKWVEEERRRANIIMAKKRRMLEKKKEEQRMLPTKKPVPLRPPEGALAPLAPKKEIAPKPTVKEPIPFITPIIPEKLKPSLLQCPKCGVPGVVTYLKPSARDVNLKIVCPIDKKSYSTKLPLHRSDQWIGEVTDQVLRCAVCGQRVQKPEKVIFKGTWAILFIDCPTHGMINPERQIYHTFYPAMCKKFENVSKKQGGRYV